MDRHKTAFVALSIMTTITHAYSAQAEEGFASVDGGVTGADAGTASPDAGEDAGLPSTDVRSSDAVAVHAPWGDAHGPTSTSRGPG